MNLQDKDILCHITEYVQRKLKTAEAGHNFSHTERVLKNARQINMQEKGDPFMVEIGALLHDVTDEKLFNKMEAEKELNEFLFQVGLNGLQISRLFELINSVSFGNEFDGSFVLTKEQKVVRDADRLDAIGAIGIARTFHYGGTKNRELYNKDISPRQYSSQEEYRSSTSPTINHFYEKLLLLRDRMETQEGKRLAQERHAFMELFLKHFFDEVGE